MLTAIVLQMYAGKVQKVMQGKIHNRVENSNVFGPGGRF